MRANLPILAALAAVLALAACGNRTLPGRGAQAEIRLPYRASLSAGADRRDFTVRVENRGAGIDEVRESVRFQATRHCLTRHGSSDHDFEMDAAGTDWAYTVQGASLVFAGRCRR
ncbi:MAG: hypothetical protein ACK4KW_13780 [Gemmobacter sp.]